MIRIVFITIMIFTLTGCSIGISRIGYNQTELKKNYNEQNCKLAIKCEAQYSSDEVEVLGKIRSYETGFSINCSEIEVLTIFCEDACALGADIVNLTWEELPHTAGSTCYRATAELLRLKDREAATQVKSDEKYYPENLIARAKLADKHFQRRIQKAIEEGIEGGIEAGIMSSILLGIQASH